MLFHAVPEKSLKKRIIVHCTEVRFASFLSGRFTTMTVINPPEKKLANRTFVQCYKNSNAEVSHSQVHFKPTIARVFGTKKATFDKGRHILSSQNFPIIPALFRKSHLQPIHQKNKYIPISETTMIDPKEKSL